jgi:hypothetical protein
MIDLFRFSAFAITVTAVLAGGCMPVSAGSPPSFRNEVMAVLSKSGCNQGTCHGNANGKGGLKLSMRGQDPDADYFTLTRQSAGRRVTSMLPAASLLLQKPAMEIPHEGGRRFSVESSEYQILRDWIASGLPRDKDTAPSLIGLTVTPAHRTVHEPDVSVSLNAMAGYSDGTTTDVTGLTVFDSSATFVTVTAGGMATAEHSGTTTIVARYLNQQVAIRLEFVSARPGFEFHAPPPVNLVDEAVFAQLRRLKINPAPLCDDMTFLRRVHLDLTGLLPTAERARAFAASEQTGKRSTLIDELLASEEFNDFQALRWADLLRVEQKTLDKTGVDVFHKWIRASFAENKPINQFTAELLAARGSTYKVPPANFYRALRKPEERAEAAAQVFLGIRLQCAKCHNHPFDHWTQDDYYGWAGFFARIEYEIVENKRRDKNDKHEFAGEQIVKMTDMGEIANPNTGQSPGLRFLGLGETDVADDPDAADDEQFDRLQRLAVWVSAPVNERFAATQANRIWGQLMGRGVVEPVDDFRSTNPPSNPELFEALRKELVTHEFDVRHLMRVILNSATYQLSSCSDDADDLLDGCFAQVLPRRLTAEQTLDAIGQVLNVPIRFGGHELGTRAVQLKGVRNGGHRYSPPEIGDRFLALFGKPNRLQTCECERTNETTLAQTFEMVSGEIVSTLLTQSQNRIDKWLSDGVPDARIVDDIYWTAISRSPSADEVTAAVRYLGRQENQRRGVEDVVWALLNSNEFLLRR